MKLKLDFIHPGFLVASPCTDSEYRVCKKLGEGAFGATYHGIRTTDGLEVCLKFMKDQDSWHKEAYFGALLMGNKRVIQLLDSFPFTVTHGARTQQLFVLAFEYASNGDLLNYLIEEGYWPEARAVSEVKALLRVLTQLHAGGALHRDITPMNIMVDAHGHLKMADFGIAVHSLGGRKVPARPFNWGFVSTAVRCGKHTRWGLSDDVFQMGQLLLMTLRGPVLNKESLPLGSARDIEELSCSELTKEVLLRAIGPRSKRYESAFEMLQAFEGKQTDDGPAVKTIKGKRLVFTGVLSIRRDDAKLLAIQNGAIIQPRIFHNTDLLVVGRKSPFYQAGNKGKKIKEVEKLRKEGYKVRLLSENQFLRLVR